MNVLVFGFYFKNNFGDDLFIDCFKQLFPTLNFTFTDSFTKDQVNNTDIIFFGGGSFLTDDPKISLELINLIKDKKIFYIGVGTETNIHPVHKKIMSWAKLIATRSVENISAVKEINANVILIPDLVYCLPRVINNNKINKSILIIPNIYVVPKWNEPHWKHSAWDTFKTEFCQVLDEYHNQGYKINFLPMSINDELNDNFAAIEIINAMQKSNSKLLINRPDNVKDVLNIISQYEIVISQRFHGIVLAALSETPCLSIFHHEKLRNESGANISYYGLYKNKIIEQINFAKSLNVNDNVLINSNTFNELTKTILDLIS